ncbi:NAD(+) synthase [Lachnospiraceae bacterium]|nr:NAD(+) synthase [Lachnospiraceae bacterium]
MEHGFVKAAAVTPRIKVADTVYNSEQIILGIEEAATAGAKLIVCPELCITGYTCGDLFLQGLLLRKAQEGLFKIAGRTREIDALIFVGLPLVRENKLYNVAAALYRGEVRGLIPKANIPAYAEFYESRHFEEGNREPVEYVLKCQEEEQRVLFGTNLLFEIEAVRGLKVGCEICEDIWVADSPANSHAKAGATVIVNLSASDETVGKDEYRELLVKSSSGRNIAGYVYTSAGEGESSQDLVFGGHNIIAENGTVLSQSRRFANQTIYGDIDIGRICHERRRMGTYRQEADGMYRTVKIPMKKEKTEITRTYGCLPFVPEDKEKRNKRCDEILSIQSCGMKKRYEHTGCKKAVIGISGGLDSTLALLVAARTFDMLSLERKNIVSVTMPCFGTTDRTYDNACKLARVLGTELREIPVKEAVALHFEEIGQDMDNHDVTYENSQARERTQVLMDVANQENALVIGTGDMSELALGWATYNGDHMSMYGVNAGVPKTLVRHLVQYYANTCGNEELKAVLLDVLDTPVSPELLPPVDGVIAQKTEDLVGPYELHDFFLYYMLRCGFEPDKIYRIACMSFAGQYEKKVILKWLKTFYRRFFAQQFKRSCLPDGPKVGSVALSPRGDLRMPSDACGRIWLEELEK